MEVIFKNPTKQKFSYPTSSPRQLPRKACPREETTIEHMMISMHICNSLNGSHEHWVKTVKKQSSPRAFLALGFSHRRTGSTNTKVGSLQGGVRPRDFLKLICGHSFAKKKKDVNKFCLTHTSACSNVWCYMHTLCSQMLTVVLHFLSGTFCMPPKKTSPPHFVQALFFLSPHHLNSFFVRGLTSMSELNAFPSHVFCNSIKLFSLYWQVFFSFSFSVKRRCSDFAHASPCWAWKSQLENYTLFHEGRASKKGLVICLAMTTASTGQTMRLQTPKACRSRTEQQRMQGNHYLHELRN